MVALRSASGAALRIQSSNRSSHSGSARHHCGFLAMMLPLQSGKPQASSVRFTSSAKARSFVRTASRSSPSRSGKMIALSWSVASVCSLRPSLPSPIQQYPTAATSWLREASTRARSVTASFRAETNCVICSAATPCASMAVPRPRTSRAAKASASTLSACPISLRSPCMESRCSPKRSRSEITPASISPSRTSRWRKPRLAMSCAASLSAAEAGSEAGAFVITSSTGRSRDWPASATRSSTSVWVKMPAGQPLSSRSTTEPMRLDFMSSSTCRTVEVCGSVMGPRRRAERSGEAIVSSLAARPA